MISFVWAEDEHHGIGVNGHLPWHLPADLQHFKEKTMGHPILMGKNTFVSLPHLLPGRQHIVLTHDENLEKKYQNNDQVTFLNNIAQMHEYLKEHSDEHICAIGGVSIFNSLCNQVDILEKTKIYHVFEADTFMPEINYDNFELVKRKDFQADEKNKYDYSFLTYKRI